MSHGALVAELLGVRSADYGPDIPPDVELKPLVRHCTRSVQAEASSSVDPLLLGATRAGHASLPQASPEGTRAPIVQICERGASTASATPGTCRSD